MNGPLTCPHCEMVLEDARAEAGQSVECPFCYGTFRVGDSLTETPAHPRPSDSPVPDFSFSFACPRCGSVLTARRSQSDSPGRCPTCGFTFVIPRADPRTGLVVGQPLPVVETEPPQPMHAYAAAGQAAPHVQRRTDGTQYIVCPRCSAESPVEADWCRVCHLAFTIEGAESAVRSATRTDTIPILACVFGLVSLVTFCLPIFGPAAVVLGAISVRRTRRRRLAIIGIVTGALSILFTAISWWKP